MHGALSGGLWLFFLMSWFLHRALAAGLQRAGLSLSFPALTSEKLLENTFSIFLADSFVAWLACALVQRITYCSSWMLTFPLCSAHTLVFAPYANTTYSSTCYKFHNWVVLPTYVCCVIACFASWNRQESDLQSRFHLIEWKRWQVPRSQPASSRPGTNWLGLFWNPESWGVPGVLSLC